MLSALAAALAVWGLLSGTKHRMLRRLGTVPAPADRTRPGGPRGLGLLAVAAGVVVAALVGGGRGAMLALAAGIVARTIWTLRRRTRLRRRLAGERTAVAAAAEALSGLLRVGSIPVAALESLAVEQPVLAEAAAEHAIGGDVVGALRRGAQRPGREGLGELAAAWEVAARTGASMESAIEVIADDLHGRQERAATVRVELAASRLAGRLLAALPVAGVGLGYAFGGDPLAFLTGNAVGLACLLAATCLACAGLLWTDSLATRAGG